MNWIGYQLMGNDELDRAIEIFKLNTEVFPDAYNAFDSLGEAYMTKGKNELAIQNYKKSVQLNPENENGIKMLEKLKGR